MYHPRTKRIWKIRDRELPIGTHTLIMGILNVTPDSFSDGGLFESLNPAMTHAEVMAHCGADIIDVGGESTRPGSTEISAEEECARVLPVVDKLTQRLGTPVSVDTYKAETARRALAAGAHIINDVWGFQREPQIAEAVAEYQAGVVLMHNQLTSEYQGDLLDALKAFFEKSLEIAQKAGVAEASIVLDPGIGFGKTYEHNIEILARAEELHALGFPLLLGTSRKSFIGKILDVPPNERTEGTLATSVMGAMAGFDIVRVHDISENLQALHVADTILAARRHLASTNARQLPA